MLEEELFEKIKEDLNLFKTLTNEQKISFIEMMKKTTSLSFEFKTV
jgi:hypothetical protein